MCILHFSAASDQVQAIESGIEDLARASCVKFRPYQKGDRDAVVIQVLISSYRVKCIQTLHSNYQPNYCSRAVDGVVFPRWATKADIKC